LRKRTTLPLTFGEYDSPLDKHTFWSARLRLMARVQMVYPRMLEELRDDVFPLFEDYVRTLPGGWLDYPTRFEREHEALRARITTWASRFHADGEEWITEAALRTLDLWLRSQTALAELRWHPDTPAESLMNYTRNFEFKEARWEPEIVTWAQYRHDLRKKFEIALHTYQKEVEKKARELGRERVRVSYSEKNLDWFILYQFGGLSSVEIEKQNTNVAAAARRSH